MPGLPDLPGNHTVRQYVPGQATAGTVDSFPIFVAPGKITITAVRWIPAAAVTGAVTNNFALQLQNRGQAGAGTTGVTAVKTYDNAINSVAHASESLALSGTAANLNAVANDVLALIRTVNGTGIAMPDGAVEIDFRYAGV